MTERHERQAPPTWLKIMLPAGLVMIAAGVVAATVLHQPDETREATLTAGTTLVGALDHTVSTTSSQVGDPVTLKTVDAVTLDGQQIVPPGATIQGEVTYVHGGGRVAGAPELTLRFTNLDTDGRTYRVEVVPFRVRGHNDATESAAEIGGGAVAGGVVGAVLGGGGGALKGAAVGAVLGTGVAVATKGDQLTLPAGQKLRLRLSAPVAVRYRPGIAS